MVFASTVFLFVFFPASVILYYNPLCRKRGWRNAILLLTSLVFYAWGEPVFIGVMLLSVLINYACGLRIAAREDKRARKAWLCLAIGFDVGLMFVFKYLNFTFANLGLLLGADAFPSLHIRLPVGISFFTFQIMSYVFDVYYGKTPAQRSLPKLALYISMFPQLIAGPIVRYETVADEIDHRVETKEDFTRGMTRVVQGLAKKVLLANYVALIADNVFARIGEPMALSSAWLGAVAYSLQIYFDFSGYSDMAIGMGLMFGFHFQENFNYAYISDSITDFWRRWHISLSQWFRDYVYIPLGGNRVSRGKWIRNLFAVWLLTGIWHGASWTFLLWGMYYFVLLLFEKFSGFPQRIRSHRVICHLYALFFTAIGWVIFRDEAFGDTLRYIGNMVGIGVTGLSDAVFAYYFSAGKWVLLAACVFSTPVLPAIHRRFCASRLAQRTACVVVYDLLRSAALLIVFLLCAAVCAKSTYNPFIYFNF